MKKVLSVFLSLVMLLSCFGIGSISASANDIKKAPTITLNNKVTATIDTNSSNEADRMFFIKFVPSKNGYYEFNCATLPKEDDMIAGVVVSSNGEDVVGIGVFDSTAKKFVTVANLKAKKTYYFAIYGEFCGVYKTDVTVRTHSHKLSAAMAIPATYDKADNWYEDGGKYQYCTNGICDYEKTLETYYYPKSMTLSTSSYTYNGKKKTPKVTVKDRKGKVIAASNYKVTYKNNTKPGKATVTVKFNGKKYEGTMTKTFIIKPKKQTLSSVKSTKSKRITIKWKRDANVTGYQLQYSTDKKFKKGNKSVTISKNKTTSKTVSKLKGKKKYYVRIRAYKTINGKKQYGAWSSVKSVTTKR